MRRSRGGKPAYEGIDTCVRARIASVFRVLLVFLLLATPGACERRKGLRKHLDRFFCSVDQDGDGEIEQHEATKFLSSFGAKLDSTEESKYDSSGGNDAFHDFVAPHNFKGDFSYGGATISVEEMLDHLQNMLTADRVVDWIIHGLQLPQYAHAFRENAVNGLDFPALVEDQSQTLLYDLQVQSRLHRKKITYAIVRQMFGYGAVPGSPENAMCVSSSCGMIQLHWDPPSFVGYPPLHKYLIHKRIDNSSSWMSIGDSKENSFLDKDGSHQGKFSGYRIQAWGDHGPSDWVQIHSCHHSDIRASNDHCAMTFIAGRAQPTEDFIAASKLSNTDLHGIKVSQRSAGWGWMYLANCLLLILGIISRHSLFFRIILASWTLFRAMVLGPIHRRLMEAQGSQYILWRMAGWTFSTFFYFCLFMQSKIWDLSWQVNGRTFSSNPCSPSRRELVAEIKSYNYTDEHSGTAQSAEDLVIRALYNEDSFSSKVSSETQGSALNLKMMQCTTAPWESRNQNIDGSMNSFLLDTRLTDVGDTRIAAETDADLRSKRVMQGKCMKKIASSGTIDDREHLNSYSLSTKSKKRSSSAPNGRVIKSTEISADTMDMADHRKTEFSKMHGRNRYRCNYEGCKARFDRWHYISDWQMKFQKHYCRDCQNVFCVKHTRISPHGPLGRCGLETNCLCQACFQCLPLEVQKKLEQINKLRVGPYASGDSLSHAKKRKHPILKNALSHSKNKFFNLSSKNSMHESQNEHHWSHNIAKDPYPPKLDLACSSDSTSCSLSD